MSLDVKLKILSALDHKKSFLLGLKSEMSTIFNSEAYGHSDGDLSKRVPLTISDEKHYYEYLKFISSEYPFLSIIGLRVITELKLKSFLSKKGIDFSEKDTLGPLIKKLPNGFPAGQAKSLCDFLKLENSASHGYVVELELASWALDAIPAFLKSIEL